MPSIDRGGGGITAENPLEAAANLLDEIRGDLAQPELAQPKPVADHAARPHEIRRRHAGIRAHPRHPAPILRALRGCRLGRGPALVVLGSAIAALALSLSDKPGLLDRHVALNSAAARVAPSAKESTVARSDDAPSTGIAGSAMPPPLDAPAPERVAAASNGVRMGGLGPDPRPRPNYAQRFAEVNATERDCLRRAVYYEARGEPVAGQIAVAQVILNRVNMGRWPHSICSVINQGVERGRKCQFSFACRRSRAAPRGEAWQQAVWVADEVLNDGAWLREMSQATHFHRHDVAPVWRLALTRIARVGAHVFYAPAGASPDTSFASAETGVVLAGEQVPLASDSPTPGPGPIGLSTSAQARPAQTGAALARQQVPMASEPPTPSSTGLSALAQARPAQAGAASVRQQKPIASEPPTPGPTGLSASEQARMEQLQFWGALYRVRHPGGAH